MNKRLYTIEIEFDTDIPLAETERRVCASIEELTLKVYFFEGDVSRAPEVVVPHDHRYGFDTSVLAGRVINRTYLQSRETERGAVPFEEFDYLTPLNGGDGFTWRRSLWLREASSNIYERDQSYFMYAPSIHTIQIAAPDTVLFLAQGKDEVPLGDPTSAFRPDGYREAPSLEGLYKKMPIDECISRLRAIAADR